MPMHSPLPTKSSAALTSSFRLRVSGYHPTSLNFSELPWHIGFTCAEFAGEGFAEAKFCSKRTGKPLPLGAINTKVLPARFQRELCSILPLLIR